MTDFNATMIAEGVDEANAETQLKAWAHLIRTGLAYRLQGWFGRTAANLIDSGYITSSGEITDKGYDAVKE